MKFKCRNCGRHEVGIPRYIFGIFYYCIVTPISILIDLIRILIELIWCDIKGRNIMCWDVTRWLHELCLEKLGSYTHGLCVMDQMCCKINCCEIGLFFCCGYASRLERQTCVLWPLFFIFIAMETLFSIVIGCLSCSFGFYPMKIYIYSKISETSEINNSNMWIKYWNNKVPGCLRCEKISYLYCCDECYFEYTKEIEDNTQTMIENEQKKIKKKYEKKYENIKIQKEKNELDRKKCVVKRRKKKKARNGTAACKIVVSSALVTNNNNEVVINIDAISRIQYRNKIVNDDRLCCICTYEPSNTFFLPCGHLKCCQKCSAKIDICPICRSKIEEKRKVYV